jgi:hypothetical protein
MRIEKSKAKNQSNVLNDSTYAPHPLPLPSGERGRMRGFELDVKELFVFVLESRI